MSVRAAIPSDSSSIGRVAEAAGLFPADMLPEMIAPAFSGDGDVWRVAITGAGVEGFAFARPEALTDRTWNLLAIGVLPEARGQGLATLLLSDIETTLGARMIVIETTQLPEQAAARAFYAKTGYEEEGRERDFYSAGEDKVIFRKVFS